MDNKRLYESIMTSVSLQVKKTLNEYKINNNLKSIFIGDTQNSDVSINWHNKKQQQTLMYGCHLIFLKKVKKHILLI